MGEPAKAVASTKVITGECRASYVYAFRPDEREKYKVTLLIPKGDRKTLGAIEGAIETAANRKWPQKRPARIATTLHDGDGERPSDGEPFGPECKGHMVMTVTSKDRPGIVDRAMREVIDPNEFQSGDYCRVSIYASAYEVEGKKGVSFYLNNIQVLRKGEPLGGGRARAEDDFDSLEEEEAW